MPSWSINSLNRRQFFQAGANLTLAGLLSEMIPGWVRKSLADVPDLTTPNFVLFRTFGGMDVTLGLDPQVMPTGATETDLFLEYRPEDIIHAEGLRLGPAAAALAPLAKHCLVVNGVMMRRDAGHDVLSSYMTTGRGDGKAAAISAEIGLATEMGPFGILMNNGMYLAGKSAIVSQTTELATEANNETLSNLIEEKTKASIPSHTPLAEAEKAVLAARIKAQEFTRLLGEFSKKFEKLESIHILLAALATGACYQAHIDLQASVFMDTHSNHEGGHLRGQKSIWDQVANFLNLLESTQGEWGKLLDFTTVMVISEFSRTPALNAAKGKDHNPFTNSVLLAGRGLNGGKTVGKSRVIPEKQSKTRMPEHYAVPFNYQTGESATSPTGASFFYPENVIRTVAKLYGDPASFKAVNLSLPVIPGIVV